MASGPQFLPWLPLQLPHEPNHLVPLVVPYLQWIRANYLNSSGPMTVASLRRSPKPIKREVRPPSFSVLSREAPSKMRRFHLNNVLRQAHGYHNKPCDLVDLAVYRQLRVRWQDNLKCQYSLDRAVSWCQRKSLHHKCKSADSPVRSRLKGCRC